MKNIEEQVVILEEWLSAIEQSATAESNDKWLVISLLKSAQRTYKHLRNGWPSDSTYTAWACRNLLELRIFTKYVTRSLTDRKRFMADLTVDSSDSAAALIKLTYSVVPKSNLEDEDISSLSKAVKALNDKLKFEGKSYLSATDLAKKMGFGEEFSALHKICSKLVHPTAQSILSIDLEDQHQRDALFILGGGYLIDLMNDLVPFIQLLNITG